jgi:hypothetical protein
MTLLGDDFEPKGREENENENCFRAIPCVL